MWGAAIRLPGERTAFPHNAATAIVSILARRAYIAKKAELDVIMASPLEWTAIRPQQVPGADDEAELLPGVEGESEREQVDLDIDDLGPPCSQTAASEDDRDDAGTLLQIWAEVPRDRELGDIAESVRAAVACAGCAAALVSEPDA